MERMAYEVNGGEFGVGDFPALGVFVFVQFSPYRKPRGGGRGRDQLHNGSKAAQGLAPPIDRDKGKEAMFNFIPLAGAGWQVAHRDGNT